MSTFYDFAVKDIEGKDVSLSEYKGKVLLVVNVASCCGLTKSNYEDLHTIMEKYADSGKFDILLFPCNQFLNQEPGTTEEILDFVKNQKKMDKAHLFEKVKVNGSDAHPLFQFLKKKLPGMLFNDLKWNFTKFLIDAHGKPFKRYSPTTGPMSIEPDIKKLLASAEKPSDQQPIAEPEKEEEPKN